MLVDRKPAANMLMSSSNTATAQGFPWPELNGGGAYLVVMVPEAAMPYCAEQHLHVAQSFPQTGNWGPPGSVWPASSSCQGMQAHWAQEAKPDNQSQQFSQSSPPTCDCSQAKPVGFIPSSSSCQGTQFSGATAGEWQFSGATAGERVNWQQESRRKNWRENWQLNSRARQKQQPPQQQQQQQRRDLGCSHSRGGHVSRVKECPCASSSAQRTPSGTRASPASAHGKPGASRSAHGKRGVSSSASKQCQVGPRNNGTGPKWEPGELCWARGSSGDLCWVDEADPATGSCNEGELPSVAPEQVSVNPQGSRDDRHSTHKVLGAPSSRFSLPHFRLPPSESPRQQPGMAQNGSFWSLPEEVSSTASPLDEGELPRSVTPERAFSWADVTDEHPSDSSKHEPCSADAKEAEFASAQQPSTAPTGSAALAGTAEQLMQWEAFKKRNQPRGYASLAEELRRFDLFKASLASCPPLPKPWERVTVGATVGVAKVHLWRLIKNPGLQDATCRDDSARVEAIAEAVLLVLEDAQGETFSATLDDVVSSVSWLAWTKQGSRTVQKAIDVGNSDDRTKIWKQLQGHVFDAIKSPHANHVLKKCITVMSPDQLHCAMTELKSKLRFVARHSFGYHVLLGLMEHGHPRHTEKLISELVADSRRLCTHQWGNVVIKHILRHGTAAQRSAIARSLCKDIVHLAKHCVASYTISCALTCCAEEDVKMLIHLVLDDADQLADLSRSHYGKAVVETAVSRRDLGVCEA